jgi:hypothetical protein
MRPPDEYDPVQDRYRRVALAAAVAVQGAFARGSGVAAAAAAAAVSAGASPGEAASMAVELERLVARLGPEGIASEEGLAATIAAAARAQAAPNDGPAPFSKFDAAPAAPAVDGAALRRQLSQIHGWCPLRELASALGLPDERALVPELEGLAREGFVRIENEHVYVTESGHRYLEYQSLR